MNFLPFPRILRQTWSHHARLGSGIKLTFRFLHHAPFGDNELLSWRLITVHAGNVHLHACFRAWYKSQLCCVNRYALTVFDPVFASVKPSPSVYLSFFSPPLFHLFGPKGRMQLCRRRREKVGKKSDCAAAAAAAAVVVVRAATTT